MPQSSATAPLTSSQLPLWLGQQLAPDAPLYNMAMAIFLPAGVEVALLQEAWRQLAAENDALRLRFVAPAGIPQQTLQKAVPTLELIDLRSYSAGELTEWLGERARQPFDLSASPVDTALLLTQRGLVWYLNQHHLITDAWGVTAQVQRLSELYQGVVEGQATDSPALPSFLAYAAAAQLAPNERTQAYWESVAEKLPAIAGFNRYQKTDSEVSQRVNIPVDEALREQITAALTHPKLKTWTLQLTEFNLIATALIAFLYRLTGEERLAVGTPAHNRVSATDKRTPGVFMELFPLVTEVAGQDSFVDLYTRVRDANYNLLRHAKPGAGSSQLARGYNVVFNFINTPFSDFAGKPVRVEWIHPQAADAGHHLRLLVYDFTGKGQPKFCFELNEAVFSAQQRQDIPRQFAHYFANLLGAPEQPLGEFPLAATPWPASPPANLPGYEPSLTVLDLWAAASSSQTVALQQAGKELSYEELNAAVAQLASYLMEHGVQRGDLVPVVLNRTTDYLVSVLAILKAGAAFVPIAVTNPQGRVAQLLEEVNGKAIISHSDYAALLPASAAGVVWLDREAASIAAITPELETLNNRSAGSEDLAYVLYTSGSTGRPKGVMITHQALSLYLQYARKTYARDRPVIAPLFTSIGFDLTITSTFLPLITGGTLLLYPVDHTGPDLSLLEVVQQRKVNFLKLTPAHLRLLTASEEAIDTVKALVVGGEDFTTSAAAVARRIFGPTVEIYNEYGPTEATVGSVVRRVLAADQERASIPIGERMPFVGTVILDAFQNPVPDGVVGQLFLEGRTLAKGYFERPELTAAAFMEVAGRRLYATGDLVSREPEAGYLIYHGRTDEQVKVGGQRVEPAEIARTLEGITGVDSAIVVPRHRIHTEGEDQLIAYFIGSAAMEPQALLVQLRQQLPRHMVPQRVIRLEQFPLNANGKINYGELPLPAEDSVANTAVFVEPRDEFDVLIVDCWLAVFPLSTISITANFFDLGGDSLRGIRIVSQLNDELELDLPVNLVFRYPSILELSDFVQGHLRQLLEQMEE